MQSRVTKMSDDHTNASNILQKPYSRKITPDTESGGYLATIHELPGCMAYGTSPQEAYEKLEAAAESWLDAAIESGYPVSDPANYDSCSGRIALRISRRLHQAAAERSDIEGISLNQFISLALATYLGQASGIEKMISAATRELHACCVLTATATWKDYQESSATGLNVTVALYGTASTEALPSATNPYAAMQFVDSDGSKAPIRLISK